MRMDSGAISWNQWTFQLPAASRLKVALLDSRPWAEIGASMTRAVIRHPRTEVQNEVVRRVVLITTARHHGSHGLTQHLRVRPRLRVAF